MLRNILVVMLVIGFVGGVIGAASALFTDTASVNANAFTTGTVDISTNPTTALVTFTNMAPGDSFAAPVAVSNAGSLALRYAITSTATNADSKSLMTQLDLTVYSGVSGANCTLQDFTGGTILYGPADLGSLAGINIVGDPAAGDDTGDRTLAASASEALPLCFSVLLPLSTGNAFQNATTTATFAFVAEQTVNNP